MTRKALLPFETSRLGTPMTNPYDTYTPETKRVIWSLACQVVLAQSNATDFSKRHFNGIREKALLFFLNRAIDLSDGCARLAVQGLSTSLTTLSRSLLETLFWERWVIISDDNAKRFGEDAKNEALGLVKIYLERGHGVVVDKRTGKNANKAILKSPKMKNIPKLPSLEDVAKETGLTRIYNVGYRILSMPVHGKTLGLFETMSTEEEVLASVSVASSSLECINLVAKNWIVSRQITQADDINRILDPYRPVRSG